MLNVPVEINGARPTLLSLPAVLHEEYCEGMEDAIQKTNRWWYNSLTKSSVSQRMQNLTDKFKRVLLDSTEIRHPM